MISYVAEADVQARHERHGNRIQAFIHGAAWDPVTNPDGFRAYVPFSPRRRYVTKTYWEHNVDGRPCYMGEKAHSILAVACNELEAGRDLHTSQIARIVGCSQGYVTKVLQFFMRFRFIEITAVIRGRYGRLVGRLATRIRQSFLQPRGVSMYGGMITAKMSNYLAHKLIWADHEAYVATLKDGDLYVPASRR